METKDNGTLEKNVNEADKQNYSDELVKQIPIEDTPFMAVKMEDYWFLTLGKYRLTEKLKSLQECKDEAENTSWFRIMQIVNVMIKEHEEEKKENVKQFKNKK
jgi:hypothetical protein